MSRQHDEQRYPPAKAKKAPTNNHSHFFSFTPRQSEMAEITALIEDLEQSDEIVLAFLQSGGALSIGVSDDGGGVRVLAYDRNVPFDDRAFVSFFASTVQRAMGQLAFALWKGFLRISPEFGYSRQTELPF